MTSYAETAAHRRADEIARAIGSSNPPPSPWRTERWGCRGCGIGRPLGGYGAGSSLEQVMVATATLGLVWGLSEGEIRVMCDANCERGYLRQVERGLAPAFARIDIRVPAKAAAKLVEGPARFGMQEHEVEFICRGRTPLGPCENRVRLAQRRPAAGGVWEPSIGTLEKHLVDTAGWRRDRTGSLRWCSATCESLDGYETTAKAKGLPPLGAAQPDMARQRAAITAQTTGDPIVPVQRLDDVSFYERRAAPVNPLLVGREVGPTGRPGKKGGR
jgi:hypothetical protein